jgi:predicted ATPase
MPPASASPVASIVEGRACEPGGMLRDVAATPQSRLPVRRISADDTVDFPDTEWPRSLPVIAQVLREGIDLGAITVLVGENGSGKSTLVEAIALAYGMSPEGGSTGARHTSRQTESAVWKSLFI